tara:strand:+ start:4412 stop:5422 length:1011 start_codon:yes stop_codon:yes gene_type:complete
MKKALITGITGQDGAYLSQLLLKKGYKVYGTARRSASENFWRLEYLGIKEKINLIDFDLLEVSNIQKVIESIKPNEVYNLAAQSFVPTSFELPILTTDINSLGALRILDTIKNFDPSTRFYQASTSEMFGKVQDIPQTENTKFYPRSPYGVSKLYSHFITINYRESYNLFACSGILFNHESPLRGNEFVTKKITKSLSKIKKGEFDCMKIGNIDAKRDWGFAGDYVEAMWLMLNSKKADDYVISTGFYHSVKDFIDMAIKHLGMKTEWKGKGINSKLINKKNGKTIVKVDKKFFRPAEVEQLLGDSSKAKKQLKWKPKVSFSTLVEMMVKFDLDHS